MAEGYEKVSRDMVEGLPEGALIQNCEKSQTTAVFFPYNYRDATGTKHQERDYIGSVRFRKFCPNAYYLQNQPTRDSRPVENWRDPVQRQRAMQKAAEAKRISQERPENKQKLEAEGEFHLGVGATALAARILYDSGMVEDVARALNYDAKDTMDALNLGMHAALTAKPTYLAELESDIQKFFGKGCLPSQRASEFFCRIGQSLMLSKTIGKFRFDRYAEPGKLVALDGTRIDCNSQKISVSAVGKRKDGTTGPQINYSLVCDIDTGYPLCYRWYSGNINDAQTMSDFRTLFVEFGVNTTKVVIVSDRGYQKAAEQIEWQEQGLHYIVAAKTGTNIINNVIDEHNSEVYRGTNLLKDHFCYGVKAEVKLSANGKEVVTNAYVYFSPNKQMLETKALREELEDVEQKWLKGGISSSDNRLRFFENPKKGVPLKRNEYEFDQECYLRGFFACLSTESESLDSMLSKYRLRNEVEVLFRLMVGSLYHTTRVQSTAAMEGQLFVVFIALTILSRMRQLLQTKVPKIHFVQAVNAEVLRTDDQTGVIADWMTRSQLFKKYQRIMLVKDKKGKCRLLSLTKGDKELAEVLGFPGLFDSASAVDELLSAKKLVETIEATKARDAKARDES